MFSVMCKGLEVGCEVGVLEEQPEGDGGEMKSERGDR